MTGENKTRKPLIFISAAEQSADQHGAALIHALLSLCPQARFVGVAGPKMISAGCDSIFDMTGHAAMLLGAIGLVGRAARMMTTADEYLRRFPFDAAVVIDSPTLHLPLAGRAHATGIPVLYYIAPQMWAWGKYRIHKLRNRVDRVATILPFEEAFFRAQGVDATYVGHPLGERFQELAIDASTVDQIRERGRPCLALLPGSRKHVVQANLPGQLEVADRLSRIFPKASVGVSVANPQVAGVIDRLAARAKSNVQVIRGRHHELIQAADLVLVTSGTTTLEVAMHGKPMIVMYNSSPFFYHLIARWLISTPHLSLPNILANREIVPEFMPYYRSTDPIVEQATQLLQSEEKCNEMKRALEQVTEPLRQGRASENTARMLLDMIEQHSH